MIKIYYKETEFTWGKHKGECVEQVMRSDKDYIEWCIMNRDYIAFEESVVEELNLPEEYQNKNSEKLDECYSYEDYDDTDYDRDTWYAMTDGQYGDYPGGDIDYDEFGF